MLNFVGRRPPLWPRSTSGKLIHPCDRAIKKVARRLVSPGPFKEYKARPGQGGGVMGNTSLARIEMAVLRRK